jgi:hypothetical protein
MINSSFWVTTWCFVFIDWHFRTPWWFHLLSRPRRQNQQGVLKRQPVNTTFWVITQKPVLIKFKWLPHVYRQVLISTILTSYITMEWYSNIFSSIWIPAECLLKSHAYETTWWIGMKLLFVKRSHFSFCLDWTVLMTIYMKTCLHFCVHDNLHPCSVPLQSVGIRAVLVKNSCYALDSYISYRTKIKLCIF